MTNVDGFASGSLYVGGAKVLVSGDVLPIVSGINLELGFHSGETIYTNQILGTSGDTGISTVVNGSGNELLIGNLGGPVAITAISGIELSTTGGNVCIGTDRIFRSGDAIMMSGQGGGGGYVSGDTICTEIVQGATQVELKTASGAMLRIAQGDGTYFAGHLNGNNQITMSGGEGGTKTFRMGDDNNKFYQTGGEMCMQGNLLTRLRSTNPTYGILFTPNSVEAAAVNKSGMFALSYYNYQNGYSYGNNAHFTVGSGELIYTTHSGLVDHHVFVSGDTFSLNGTITPIYGQLYDANASFKLVEQADAILCSKSGGAAIWSSGIVSTGAESPLLQRNSGLIIARASGIYEVMADGYINGVVACRIYKNGAAVPGAGTYGSDNISQHALVRLVSGDEVGIYAGNGAATNALYLGLHINKVAD